MNLITISRIALVSTLFFIACGDDNDANVDYTSVCINTLRFGIEGQVGPTVFNDGGDPYRGRAGEDFFDLVLEDGEEPHLIVFDFHLTSSADNFRDALRARIDSGAANASVLNAVFREESSPCDPAQGVVCVSYGKDPNGDGNLLGSSEIIYRVSDGTLTVLEVTGNNLLAHFDLTFDPQSSGEAEGGLEGGALTGCFNLNLDSSLSQVD